MKKKLIMSFATLCTCLSLTVCAFAYTPKEVNRLKANNNPEVYSDPLYNTEETITDSELFIPDKSGNMIPSNRSIGTRAVVPSYYGQVRVDKSNSGDSGIADTAKKTGAWSTIKYATIKVLPYIPGIGQIAGNGYGPTAINKAAHYNNSSGLSQIFYEHWKSGIGPYYETY